MKPPKKKLLPRRLYIVGVLIVIVAVVAGGLFYHHYEYQNLTFHFSDGSGATMSRHNFNEMTAAEKQAFLHPVNENALHPCVGNPIDQCISTPSADFWPIGSEGATNPYLKYPTTSSPNEEMGRIINDASDTIQLKTSSGRIIAVDYPLDPVANFNTNYAAGYDFKIGIGDEIFVNYIGSMTNNTIRTNQIMTSTIVLKGNAKTGPVVKY
jgi:hypothetical protein